MATDPDVRKCFNSNVTRKLYKLHVLEHIISSSNLIFSVTPHNSQPRVTTINFHPVRVFNQNYSFKILNPDKKFTDQKLPSTCK